MTTTGMIDCDVHTNVPSDDVFCRYLEPDWVEHHRTFSGNSYHVGRYPRAVPQAARRDAWPPAGPPGSDLAFTREQLLDAWDMRYAVLGPLLKGIQSRNPDYAAAVSRATNAFTRREWLDGDDRLRGSIITPYEHPDLAAAEIDRAAQDPRFVQVYMQVRTSVPLGNRKFWPMFAAAVRNGLPLGVHYGGIGGNPLTAAGWPSYYIEDHAGNAQSFQSQVASLIFEGVFDRFPELRIVLIEGGIAWVPSLAWRMDAAFERLGREVRHLKRRPSEYLADHLWFTTQPIEEPPRPASLVAMFDAFPSLETHVMFASDYPHWDFDDPVWALKHIPFRPEVREAIMRGNAAALYGLEVA